jgi:hypothetical protein
MAAIVVPMEVIVVPMKVIVVSKLVNLVEMVETSSRKLPYHHARFPFRQPPGGGAQVGRNPWKDS